MARCVVCTVALGVLASASHAHDLKVVALVRGGKVVCRSFFATGGAPKHCPITVLLPGGKPLLEGRTDENGRFVFEPTVRADLTIVVDPGQGHQAKCVLEASRLPTGPGAAPPVPAPVPPATQAVDAVPPPVLPPPVAATAMERDAMEAIVRAAVRDEVTSLRDEVGRLREELTVATHTGPGITEVLGGIGYIVGLMGLVMVARSRSRGSSPQDKP